MKFKSVLIVGSVLLIFSILIFVSIILTSEIEYKEVLQNIDNNYSKIKLNISNFSGKLKTEHTSNMVHTLNNVSKEEYDLRIEVEDEYIYIYLDNIMSKIDISHYKNLFTFTDIDNCDFVNKEKDKIYLNNKNKNVFKYKYLCDNRELLVYTSLFLKKQLAYELRNKDESIIFWDNDIKYNNRYYELNYSNITDNSYVAKIEQETFKFNLYYSFNDYNKYNIKYNDVNFNIIDKNNTIKFSLNCDIAKYSKLQISLIESPVDIIDSYKEVSLDVLLEKILKKEILNLFS